MSMEDYERILIARDALKVAQEKVVELTSNTHLSLKTRSLYDAVRIYNEAVIDAILALDGSANTVHVRGEKVE